MQPADKSNLLRSEAELQLEKVWLLRASLPCQTTDSLYLSLTRCHRQARKDKAERTKDVGSPIEIAGKALAIQVRGNVAWIAENTTVIRKLDLEVGARPRAIACIGLNGIGRRGRRSSFSKGIPRRSPRLHSSTESRDLARPSCLLPARGIK